jgi:type I restriction enzyme M protein
MLITGHNPDQIAFGNTLTDDAHTSRSFHYMLSNPPYGVDWKKYQDPIRKEHAEKGFDGRFGPGLPRVSDGQLLFLLHMISKMRDDEHGSRIGIVMNGSPLFTGGAGSGESEIRRWMLEQDLVEAIVALPTDLFYNTGIQTYVWLLNNRKKQHRRGKVQLINASSERFWQPMRKSLGSKRRQIPDSARDEIVHIYNAFEHGDSSPLPRTGEGPRVRAIPRPEEGSGVRDVSGEGGTGGVILSASEGSLAAATSSIAPQGDSFDHSRVFSTTQFGYREIRVERPLRLAFEVSEERLAALAEERVVERLSEQQILALLEALRHDLAGQRFTNRDAFDAALTTVLKRVRIPPSPPLREAITAALSERDEEADICRDAKGNPEPDTDLRDHELVPLGEDWRDYVTREVLPFVPDAWVDESYRDERDGQVGRVGYEINFNRYFYKYVPPRPLEEIDAELRQLEAEIAALLQQVTA